MINTYLSSLLQDAKHRLTPFKQWAGELQNPEILKADIIAGATVALVLIPQSMAYAQLAGLPPHIGLYASFLVPIIAALFGSSRQLQNGPVAIISLMTAAALASLGLSLEQYIIHAAILALMVGVFQLVLGFLRLGILVDFLSHPVVIGFTNAAAIVIGSLQIGKLFGISMDSSKSLFETYGEFLKQVPTDIHFQTLIMGVFSLFLLIYLRKAFPKLPGILITVLITTLVSWMLGYETMGGGVVGEVTPGLPAFVFPVAEDLHFQKLIMPAIIIALLSFVEAFSIAKAVASKTRQRISADQEMVGKGLANIVAGVTQGYAVSGSFSRTAVAFDAGAKTGFAAIVTGVIVGITLLFLTPLLYHLPLATLAAIIIVAVYGMIKFEPFKHAWSVNPHDGVIALIVFITTLVFAPHLEYGIFIGVILSITFYLYRTMQPHFAELAKDKEGVFRDAEIFGMQTSETFALFRYDGDLYFANAGYLEKRLLNAVADKPKLRALVLDLEAVDQIDATGEEMLAHMAEGLREAGITFCISRPKHKLVSALQRSGLYEKIGTQNFYGKRIRAIWDLKERLGDEVDISHLEYYKPANPDEVQGSDPTTMVNTDLIQMTAGTDAKVENDSVVNDKPTAEK
ncbi:SulP family inorganic anion transporter [Leucothrix pacifica]|uniref:Sodium-independent anion transporter n=1 Tax=Leucothrix pacifica TaxID=1247513 RepID=A0A317C2B3_9GAMM|nr:sulfate permease [Leucothrix pacifica]PWQ92489.1 sodium-independent anion transporter [Leucothrix pacifica]